MNNTCVLRYILPILISIKLFKNRTEFRETCYANVTSK